MTDERWYGVTEYEGVLELWAIGKTKQQAISDAQDRISQVYKSNDARAICRLKFLYSMDHRSYLSNSAGMEDFTYDFSEE
jgi:hypothetical protein